MLIKKVAKLDENEVESVSVIKDIKHDVCNYLMNKNCDGCPFECCCEEFDNLLEQMIEDKELKIEG